MPTPAPTTTPEPAVLEASEPDLAGSLGAAMADVGAAVVRGVDVGRDEALLDVVGRVATPSDVGNGGGFIYDVTPRPEGEQVDLSSTDRKFPLHSDSTFLVAPHDVIALGCLDAPADGGGDSLLLDARVAQARLGERENGEALLGALAEGAFPFVLHAPDGTASVAPLSILRHDGERLTVRYRDDIMATAGKVGGTELTPRHREALDAFESLLADPALFARFSISPGDVLLVDNRRMLHGRTAITPGAGRVMRRVKAFVAPAG